MTVTVKITGSKAIGLTIAGELTRKVKVLYGKDKTEEVAPQYIDMVQAPEGDVFCTVVDLNLKNPAWIDEIALTAFKHRKTAITISIN